MGTSLVFDYFGRELNIGDKVQFLGGKEIFRVHSLGTEYYIGKNKRKVYPVLLYDRYEIGQTASSSDIAKVVE